MMGMNWFRFTSDDNFTTQEKRTFYLVKYIVQLKFNRKWWILRWYSYCSI